MDGDDDVQINQQPSITVGGVEEQANSYSAWEDEGSASNDDEDMDGGDDYSSSEEEDDDEPGVGRNPPMHGDVPIIFPRARFAGHANVETVKDGSSRVLRSIHLLADPFSLVNFVGPYDEYVASGSDDGNFFLYNKSTKKIHGIYEGDGSIVNVIEPHPRLPVIATSGIDTTVKVSPAIALTPDDLSTLFTLALYAGARRKHIFTTSERRHGDQAEHGRIAPVRR